MSEVKYDTVVVGGGMAGLTAAIYLARSEHKVLLVEKNRECGGLVNTFNSDGFYFDSGVRALLDAGIIFTMLKDLNINLEVVKSPVSIGIENEILNIKDIDSLEDYSNLLKKFYPASGSDIDKVIKIIRRIMRHMDVLYGIENPVFKDLKRDPVFVFTKILPWFPRFLLTVRKINRMNAPVEEYLTTIVKDPSLRDMISQHFFQEHTFIFCSELLFTLSRLFLSQGRSGKTGGSAEEQITGIRGRTKDRNKDHRSIS